MYRTYEDPYKLEKELKQLKALREKCTDEDELIELDMAIQDLKDRINFAWQDDEYECDYDDLAE